MQGGGLPADVTGELVELVGGHVQPVAGLATLAGGVLQHQVLAVGAVDGALHQLDVAADAVLLVHDVVAGLELQRVDRVAATARHLAHVLVDAPRPPVMSLPVMIASCDAASTNPWLSPPHVTRICPGSMTVSIFSTNAAPIRRPAAPRAPVGRDRGPRRPARPPSRRRPSSAGRRPGGGVAVVERHGLGLQGHRVAEVGCDADRGASSHGWSALASASVSASPNGDTVHHGRRSSPARARTSARVRKAAAPRSIGASPPTAAAAQPASRNSSEVRAGRGRGSGCAPGRRAARGCRPACSRAAVPCCRCRPAAPGRATPSPRRGCPRPACRGSPPSSGCAAASSAARRRTSGVSSSSRQGGAHSRGTASMVRWSATAKVRISSTSSPQNSTRDGCSSVGGKTSRMPPRTANSPRLLTRSTRAYAMSVSRRTSSRLGPAAGAQLHRLQVAEPLELRLEQRAHRRDHHADRPPPAVAAGCASRRSTASRRPTVSERGESRSCGRVSQDG